ncbi:MAG: hypothetical protein AB8H86_24305 [Polyangiales bacterium]
MACLRFVSSTKQRRGRALALLLVGVFASSAAVAQTSSQEPTEAPDHVAEAARHQARALQLLTEAEVSEALRELDLSIALHPTPEARFNRAAALRRVGRLVEARQQLISLRSALDEGRLATAVEGELAELNAELPTIMVRVPDADEAEVRIDGLLYGIGGRGNWVATPLDPGSHVVDVREEQRAGRREIAIRRGEVARVELELDELLGQDPRLLRRRLGVTLAVVVVLLGVAAAVIATQVRAEEPRMLYDEGIVPRVETLSFGP